MLLPLAPLRSSDLLNTQQAVLAHAEQILAYSRLPAERALSTDWGVLINQAEAIRKWRGPLESTLEHCHLLDLVELDRFGVTALLNRKIGNLPERDYIAICPWNNAPLAATHLRVRCLARALHPDTALATHATEIAYHLEIPERSLNDARLPSRSKIRSGTLLRLDSDSAKALRGYFNLVEATNLAEPAIAELGADSYLIYAAANNPEEPLRAILANQLFLPIAQKELSRWLKSLSSNRKETSLP